jgi:hypothetical protein
MKPTTFVLAAFLCVTMCGKADARAQEKIVISDLKGNDLLRLCTSHDTGELNFCSGYIEGIRDGIVWADVGRKSQPRFAVSDKVTQQQLKDVVVKYLNEHPETRHKPAGMLILIALNEAFPPEPGR